MSMLKKFIVAAVLISTVTPVLASDTSDDARAARQARETASEARAASERVDGGTAHRNSKVEGTDHPTGESTGCECRCAPKAGSWSHPEPLPDYGG